MFFRHSSSLHMTGALKKETYPWSQADEIGIGDSSGCFNQIGRLLTQTGLDRFLIFRHTLSVRHLEDLQNVPRPWKRTGVLCLGVGLI